MYSINQNFPEKYYRLDEHVSLAGVDALVCLLPENVVYLTGTYPVHGVSVAVYLPRVGSFLLHPECEQEWIAHGDCGVSLFGWGHINDKPIEAAYTEFLSNLYGKYQLTGKRIGVEMNVKTCAPAYRSAEMNLPDDAFLAIVKSNFSDCTFIDCGPIVEGARAIKFPDDIVNIKRSNAIAQLGLAELEKNIHSGMTEVEAAALVEQTIRVKGTGYEGASLVRGFAEVTSGIEGSRKQSMLIPASLRRFEKGDLVIIEMAVVADGYWSDLTRVFCVGEPNVEQKRVYNTVLKAQQAAAAVLIEGNGFSSPDEAARKVIAEAGLGEYFIHGTGHGVGWRYHEAIPQLGPNSTGVLKKGMVTSVEPGVYIPGFGGIRIEDNLMVGDREPEWLSSAVEPW